MSEGDIAALGIWFGAGLPACYLAANLALDRTGAFTHQQQSLQNNLAAWIAVPVSLCGLLAWLLLH